LAILIDFITPNPIRNPNPKSPLECFCRMMKNGRVSNG
jgi:hypothetical protein